MNIFTDGMSVIDTDILVCSVSFETYAWCCSHTQIWCQ